MKLLAIFLIIAHALAVPDLFSFLGFPGFLEIPEENCPIERCSGKEVEHDSMGQSWPTFCYKCGSGEYPVIFKRMYSNIGWTYWTNKQTNSRKYQFREIQKISRCLGQDSELDSMKKSWNLWCYSNGRQVTFLKKNMNGQWTYVEDFTGGYPQFQYRRITDVPSFLQIDCDILEGDTSERYFPAAYDEHKNKVEFQKNSKGNYVWDNRLSRRILGDKTFEIDTSTPCVVYDQSGQPLQFEKDEAYAFYWKKNFANGELVKYERSIREDEIQQGMYKISPETGKRIEMKNEAE